MMIRNPSVQAYLFGQLGQTISYDIKGTGLSLYFKGGLGFSASDIVAKSRLRDERIESSRVNIVLNLIELFKGRVVPLRIDIIKPRIELPTLKAFGYTKEGGGTVLRQMIEAGLSGLKSASIKDACLVVKGLPYGFKGLDFDLYSDTTDLTRLRLKVNGGFSYNTETVMFSLAGVITEGLEKISAKAELSTGRIPLNLLPCPAFLPFSNGSAKVDVMLNARLGGPVSAQGKILGENAHFSVIEHGRTKQYDLSSFELAFDASYFEQVLEISSAELKGPEFSAIAHSRVDFKDIKNPHISINVKSPFMPLETFKRVFPTSVVPSLVEYDIFPICSGGEARLKDLSLNGALEQFRHFCLPENGDLLSMKVEWKDMVVNKDGKGLPFEKVSGDVVIEKQGLLLTISNAVFGTSIVKGASLKINPLCGDHSYNITCSGIFELDDLKKQTELSFLPKAAGETLKDFKALSGKMEGQVEVALGPGFVRPRIIKGQFSFKECLIEHNNIVLPLLLDEADMRISNQEMGWFQGRGKWGKSEFQASGETSDRWKDCKFKIASRAQADELLGLFFKTGKSTLSSRDTVPCEVEIERINDHWAFKGEARIKDIVMDNGTMFLDPPGENDRAVFELDLYPGKEVRLKNLLLDLDGAGVRLNGSFDLTNKNDLWLSVSTEGLSLTGLGVRTERGVVKPKGLLTCNADLRTFFKEPGKTTINGNASGRDISFDLKGLASPVTDCNFKLELSGQEMLIRSLHMQVGQSPIDIKGRLKGWDFIKGDLTADAESLNFGDFIQKGSDSGQKTSDETLLSEDTQETETPTVEDQEASEKTLLGRSEFQFSLNAKRGKCKKFDLGPLHAKCVLRSGDLYVDSAEAQLEHGALSVKGYVKKRQGPERINIISNIKMTAQPAGDLLKSLGTDGKALEGTLNMESSLSSKGADTKGLIAGLKGNASLGMENGCITSSFKTVFKILDVLNIMNIFKTRLPDLTKKGLSFETIEAHADIKDGVIHTDDFSIKGPILNAVVQGDVDLTRKWEDLIFWAQTLETLDTVISWVPIIGYILTEKENAPKGVVIYPVQIRGDWSNPEVKMLPSVMKIGGGVINIFKRLLETPGRIFKKISGVKDGLAKAVGPLSENDSRADQPTAFKEYLD